MFLKNFVSKMLKKYHTILNYPIETEQTKNKTTSLSVNYYTTNLATITYQSQTILVKSTSDDIIVTATLNVLDNTK